MQVMVACSLLRAQCGYRSDVAEICAVAAPLSGVSMSFSPEMGWAVDVTTRPSTAPIWGSGSSSCRHPVMNSPPQHSETSQ